MIREKKAIVFISLILSGVLVYSLSLVYGHGRGRGESKGEKKGWSVHPMEVPVVPREPTLTEVNTYSVIKPEKGEVRQISFTLLEPSRVRVRINGDKEDKPVLRTLLDWEEYPAGTHTIEWNGKDTSGYIVIFQPYFITIDAEPVDLHVSSEEKELILNDENHAYGHLHGLHDILKCHDFDLRIYTPTKDEIVSGTITIGAQLTDDFLGYAKEWGFGIRYYVNQKLIDEVFIDSSEVKYQQIFKLSLDTTTYEDGEHTITINICDHNEHEGTTSVKVNFKNR